jgi:hypothetical protein
MQRYAVLALGVLLLWLAAPRTTLEARRAPLAATLLLIASASLVAVLVTLLSDWRRRVRSGQAEPPRLLDAPPRYPRFFAGLLCICLLVGLAAVLVPDAGLTPLAAVAAAYTAGGQTWSASSGWR